MRLDFDGSRLCVEQGFHGKVTLVNDLQQPSPA
jgi:hypothetical protein